MRRRVSLAELEALGIAGLVRPSSRLADLGPIGRDLAALVAGPCGEEARASGLVFLLALPDVVEHAQVSAHLVRAWLAAGFVPALWLARHALSAKTSGSDEDAVRELHEVALLCVWNFYAQHARVPEAPLYEEPAQLLIRARRRPGKVTLLCSDRPLAKMEPGYAPGLEAWLRRNAVEVSVPGAVDPLCRTQARAHERG